MRRADRLFQIVQYLRGRRLTTAAQLAGWLEVSERTVYRDIRDLAISGVPVEGEAGVGYRLGPGFDLPPIMFTMDEVEALVAGARMMETWGGPALGRHARSAMAKIALALPAARREEIGAHQAICPRISGAERRGGWSGNGAPGNLAAPQAAHRIRGWGAPRVNPDAGSSGALFLGYDVVGSGVVRVSRRLPHLPA